MIAEILRPAYEYALEVRPGKGRLSLMRDAFLEHALRLINHRSLVDQVAKVITDRLVKLVRVSYQSYCKKIVSELRRFSAKLDILKQSNIGHSANENDVRDKLHHCCLV